jgi:hypothetical protein
MYHFVTASKDATIYLQQPSQNTGLDEILEVSKTYYGSLKDIAHSVIKFETTPLSQSIASGEVTMSAADMILRECESSEIPIDYTIYAYAVTQSWEMGIGTRFDDITTDGVTWNSVRTGQDWLSLEEHSADTTGSFNGKGGTWFTGSYSSQSFSYESSDIEMDVKTTMDEWIGGTLPNEGFIIKYDTALENDTNDYGQLKFFSKETNTIYQPKLRIGWDDSLFSTGSLTALTSDDIHVTFKRLKTRYKQGSKPTIRVFGREKYPLKTYTKQYSYTDVYFLPSTSYYQVKDVLTDEIIIPFDDDYTKVSCDSSGNYFKLDLTNWEYNRNYYIQIKIDRDGVIEYFEDKDLTFTIEK